MTADPVEEADPLRKIWILCGGPSTEFDVSLKSARVVAERISLEDQAARLAVVSRDGRWLVHERELAAGGARDGVDEFLSAAASETQPDAGVGIGEALGQMLDDGIDCAFLCFHGQYGEDGRIQGFLETSGIPYTGSGILASALAFNKRRTLEVYRQAGLRIAPGVIVRPDLAHLQAARELAYPAFVKPVEGGSSVAMSLAHSVDELAAALDLAFSSSNEALVEQKIDGVEVSCGVLDLVRDGKVVTVPMPPTEIRAVASEYFDYNAKYVPGGSVEKTPAELPPAVIARIRQCALDAHRCLGCEGMSRTDMIVPRSGDREPVLLETNTIPGMTPTSLLPQQFAHEGIAFDEFIDSMIDYALLRARRCEVLL